MVRAKLIIDGKEINVLWFTFGVNQGTDTSGRPSQKPVFIGLKLIIETQRDLNLADWSFAANQTKQLELHIYPVIMGGKTRKLYFYDCHLVNWANSFSSTGSSPMSERLEITAAGVKDSQSDSEYSAYWRTTFPSNNVEATTRSEENIEPRVVEHYITDREDVELSEYERGHEIYCVLETENMDSESVDIDLSQFEVPLLYRGERIQDNIIKDYTISADEEKIPLQVISEDHEDEQ